MRDGKTMEELDVVTEALDNIEPLRCKKCDSPYLVAFLESPRMTQSQSQEFRYPMLKRNATPPGILSSSWAVKKVPPGLPL